MKSLNKRELQQIATNHSSDIDVKDFQILFQLMIQLYDEYLTGKKILPSNQKKKKKKKKKEKAKFIY